MFFYSTNNPCRSRVHAHMHRLRESAWNNTNIPQSVIFRFSVVFHVLQLPVHKPPNSILSVCKSTVLPVYECLSSAVITLLGACHQVVFSRHCPPSVTSSKSPVGLTDRGRQDYRFLPAELFHLKFLLSPCNALHNSQTGKKKEKILWLVALILVFFLS